MTYGDLWKRVAELLGPRVTFCLELDGWHRELGDEFTWRLYLTPQSRGPNETGRWEASTPEDLIRQLEERTAPTTPEAVGGPPETEETAPSPHPTPDGLVSP
jgi:hypothetical protein